MSAPTEFDTALDIHLWTDENGERVTLAMIPDAIEAIKQAVDKHVIGQPINVHGRANLYASKPGTEGLEQKWYDLGTNGRIEEQRKALWGTNK